MRFFVFACIFIALIGLGLSATPGSTFRGSGDLTVKHEQNRVVMTWSGTVEPPMKQRFEDAFRNLGSEPKRILISWNSPGGHVDHGHDVIKVIQKAARLHYIHTTVGPGQMCASMCVPLYLSGMERSAHPNSRFMFHEVILKLKPEAERTLRELAPYAPGAIRDAKKAAVSHHTDRLFEDEFESKLNNDWLSRMRRRIQGRDVWLTGRQLVQEKSGVVDKLIETQPQIKKTAGS